MKIVGLQGILTILSHLFFIWISINLVDTLDIKKFIKRDNSKRVQLLLMFIAIMMGYTVSSFFISIITSAQNLKFLF